MTFATKITVKPYFFSEKETTLVENGNLRASLFTFSTGVCGIRISNKNGSIILLPFQGQQIWSAEFDDRSIGMTSIFNEPVPTQNYLENYGAFLIHCGLTALGNPSPDDTHPLHGELPNAPYQEAYVHSGLDENGHYIESVGCYYYKSAFSYNYKAQPTVRLYEDGTTVHISMEISNLSSKPLEYMYMAHVNFLLVDDSSIITTAIKDKDNITIRKPIVDQVENEEAYGKFLDDIIENPHLLDEVSSDLILDPEMVAFYSYQADQQGWAHSLQCHPDGYASYIKHKPSEFNHAIRWMVRTEDEKALGLAIPSTAQTEGYTAEKRKGNIKIIPPKGKKVYTLEAGIIRPEEAALMRERIDEINRLG